MSSREQIDDLLFQVGQAIEEGTLARLNDDPLRGVNAGKRIAYLGGELEVTFDQWQPGLKPRGEGEMAA